MCVHLQLLHIYTVQRWPLLALIHPYLKELGCRAAGLLFCQPGFGPHLSHSSTTKHLDIALFSVLLLLSGIVKWDMVHQALHMKTVWRPICLKPTTISKLSFPSMFFCQLFQLTAVGVCCVGLAVWLSVVVFLSLLSFSKSGVSRNWGVKHVFCTAHQALFYVRSLCFTNISLMLLRTETSLAPATSLLEKTHASFSESWGFFKCLMSMRSRCILRVHQYLQWSEVCWEYISTHSGHTLTQLKEECFGCCQCAAVIWFFHSILTYTLWTAVECRINQQGSLLALRRCCMNAKTKTLVTYCNSPGMWVNTRYT